MPKYIVNLRIQIMLARKLPYSHTAVCARLSADVKVQQQALFSYIGAMSDYEMDKSRSLYQSHNWQKFLSQNCISFICAHGWVFTRAI